MNRGAWWAPVHGVEKCWTQLKPAARTRAHTHTHKMHVRTHANAHSHPPCSPPRWLSGKETTCDAGAAEMWVGSLGQEDPLDKEMATHASIPA